MNESNSHQSSERLPQSEDSSALDAWVVPPDNAIQRVADKRRQPMRLSALFEEFKVPEAPPVSVNGSWRHLLFNPEIVAESSSPPRT